MHVFRLMVSNRVHLGTLSNCLKGSSLLCPSVTSCNCCKHGAGNPKRLSMQTSLITFTQPPSRDWHNLPSTALIPHTPTILKGCQAPGAVARPTFQSPLVASGRSLLSPRHLCKHRCGRCRCHSGRRSKLPSLGLGGVSQQCTILRRPAIENVVVLQMLDVWSALLVNQCRSDACETVLHLTEDSHISVPTPSN